MLKRRRGSPEATLQRAIFQQLRMRASPGVLYWHTPNGGRRNLIEAVQLKAMGVLPGASDLMALHEGRFYALELKCAGGRPTVPQLAFIAAVNDAGGYAAWCDGLDRALAILETWKLLRPNLNARAAA